MTQQLRNGQGGASQEGIVPCGDVVPNFDAHSRIRGEHVLARVGADGFPNWISTEHQVAGAGNALGSVLDWQLVHHAAVLDANSRVGIVVGCQMCGSDFDVNVTNFVDNVLHASARSANLPGINGNHKY